MRKHNVNPTYDFTERLRIEMMLETESPRLFEFVRNNYTIFND